MDDERINLTINQRDVSVAVEPNETLLQVLRDGLGYMDVKYGCGEGVCGTCTVLFDGQPVNSCLILGVQASGHAVTTVRGLMDDPEGRALQARFVEEGAAQCGYCTPGIVLTAYYLLRENRRATREDLRAGLAGNLCRCTGYVKILDAIESHLGQPRSHSEVSV
jgi:aerobic carbon-monoxide dehydrogenase small subunit